MANFLGVQISSHPGDWARSWGLAFANLGRGIAELLSNKRLWVGIAVSVVLHGLIFFLSMDVLGGKVGEEAQAITNVGYDPSLPPKAQQIAQRNKKLTTGTTSDESAPIDISKRDVSFQAEFSTEEFTLDKGQADFTGDVIRVNPNRRLSTEEILSQAPVDLSRSVGGVGAQDPFDRIAASGGSAIELDRKGTQVGGAEVEKPTFAGGGAGPAKEEGQEKGAQKSGWSLVGELKPGDIVSAPFPPYPAWARQKGLSNVTISISFSADASGNVNPTMVVVKSTGYPNWDASVKSTLKRWKFKPADKQRREATITFRFVLT